MPGRSEPVDFLLNYRDRAVQTLLFAYSLVSACSHFPKVEGDLRPFWEAYQQLKSLPHDMRPRDEDQRNKFERLHDTLALVRRWLERREAWSVEPMDCIGIAHVLVACLEHTLYERMEATEVHV